MRILRVILGIALIPVCLAVTRTFLFLMAVLGAEAGLDRSLPILAVGAGVILWVLIFYILPRPVRMYVLAHELTHALWGSIWGARISSLRVSKTGGSVKMSDVNWFTVLAPYFFPFYTVLVVLGYYFLALFVDLRRWELVWFGLIGLTLGFHWMFALETLSHPQSDIRRYGRFFSYTLIYLLNVLGVGLIVVLVSPVTLDLFVGQLVRNIAEIGQWCGLILADVFQWVSR